MLIDTSGAYTLMEGSHASLVIPQGDDLAETISSQGYPHRELLTLLDERMSKGMTGVVFGAHVGELVVPMARHAGPGGLVVAVPQTSDDEAFLRVNVALNLVHNVVAVADPASGDGGLDTLVSSMDLTAVDLVLFDSCGAVQSGEATLERWSPDVIVPVEDTEWEEARGRLESLGYVVELVGKAEGADSYRLVALDDAGGEGADDGAAFAFGGAR